MKRFFETTPMLFQAEAISRAYTDAYAKKVLGLMKSDDEEYLPTAPQAFESAISGVEAIVVVNKSDRSFERIISGDDLDKSFDEVGWDFKRQTPVLLCRYTDPDTKEDVYYVNK